MSYYKYLKNYSPGFLRKYQSENYFILGRSTRYAEIVQMNATSSLSLDEDISLNLAVPLNITNFLAFMSMVYWYFYHVDMYAANSIKNRLRSYYNYKMWSRLEISVYKNNVKAGEAYKDLIYENWLKEKGVTRAQMEELKDRVKNGEKSAEVLESWGVALKKSADRLVKVE